MKNVVPPSPGATNGELKWLQQTKRKDSSTGRKSTENGFEAWGGYMEAKKAKLNAQFHSSTANGNDNGTPTSGIFNDISIYCNGYMQPPEPELRQLFVKHGGTFHQYRNSSTTFVIASNLSASSKALYGHITVKPEWITDSIAAGVKLNHRDYFLYNLNEEKNQRTLTQMMGGPKTRINGAQPLTSTVTSTNLVNGSPSESELSNNHQLKDKPAEESFEKSPDSNGDVDILPASDDETLDSSEKSFGNVIQKEFKIPEGRIEPQRGKVKMATEEGFLEEFFQNSRLHLISDQKKEMQNKISNMRETTNSCPFLVEFLSERDKSTISDSGFTGVTLMHIDLDCFFVSVGLLSRPHLRGKPVIVTHSTGKSDNSKSDIASASYEARAHGVHNGMWVSEAKKLCPNLEVVPYDFDEYRRVSEIFFDTVAKITLNIEPCSVDEMVVDVSQIVEEHRVDPITLADFMRRKVFDAVKCTASVGIGKNRLLAKLATKKAKPNGVYHLKSDEAEGFIKELEVRELPGIGWSHETKLNDVFNVKLCKDLLLVPFPDLVKEFGPKTAKKMLEFSRGIDTDELKYGFNRPKSISVDVNYGIRFTTQEQVSEFLVKLCKELSARAGRAQAAGLNITLKLLSRKKGAGDPKKHGGFGIVDTHTKSNKLFQPTSHWNELYRAVSKLFRLFPIPVADYRGIGLSLTDLTFDFDKSANQKKSVQRTLFDVTASRGRKMLECVKKNSLPELGKNTVGNSNGVNGQPALGAIVVNGQHTKTAPLINGHSPTKPVVNGEHGSPKASPAANNSLCQSPRSFYGKKRNDGSNNGCNLPDRFFDDKEELLDIEEDAPKPKRRKLEFTADVPASTTNDNNGNPPIDVNVLRELPENIAREIAQQYGMDYDQLKLKQDEGVAEIITVLDDDDTTAGATSKSNGHSSNPYEEIESIDPGYLCALPEALRNEVLLQFQEAQGRKVIDVLQLPSDDNTPVEPKPCSSRQALERDEGLRSIANKKPVQSKEPCYVAPLEITNPGVYMKLRCEEKMCDEIVYTTPPKLASPCRNSTSQNRFTSRRNITPTSIKKRLDFGDKSTTTNKKPLQKFDMKKFWDDDIYRPMPVNKSKIIHLPVLNGANQVEDVRNQIRECMAAIPNPVPDDDTQGLRKYFHELVTRGYLKQLHVLMKFLCRKYEALPEESTWRRIIEEIAVEMQDKCIELYDWELDLE